MIDIFMVEGDLISRCEVFDEADLDAALARFEELQPPAPRLENAASRVDERFVAYFAARDWDAMAEMLADDIFNGRSPSGGECRDPTRSRCPNRGHARRRRHRGRIIDGDRHRDPRGAPRPHSCPLSGPRPAARGVLQSRCSASSRSTPTSGSWRASLFDPDDIDAAFEELDARYLAGEAAAHAHTWSVIARGLRRAQPARTPPDDAGLGEHRSPAARRAFDGR